jgi:DNA-binding LacI/PurR family transcriptional regulator
MAEVGRRAQVSAQTVSRYFNDGYVSPESRARIEAAVAELGYRFNRLPRNLRSERTETLGFLALGPLNYGNASILTGISRAARAAGQTLMTTQFELDASDASAREQVFRDLDNLMALRVDGVVVATPYFGLAPILEHIDGAIPTVTLSESTEPGVRSAHADSYGAARLAMQHLLDAGHTRILHLAGPANRNEAGARVQGYRDALSEAGLAPLPVIECAEWDAVSGADSAARIDVGSFTAVFAANDEIALGFMSELGERGLAAPDDYSIVGIDDMPEARYFSPPLTSARLDFELVGETAVRMILDLVGGRSDTPNEVIASSLSVRRSTRAIAPGSSGSRARGR